MSDKTTTTPLPLGFTRSGRVLEPLTDEEAAPLIEVADKDPDGEKRRSALMRLGQAGIFCDMRWVPSPRAATPVAGPAQVIVPALAQAVKGCREGRQRHRYLPGGACKYCPARDPRKPQGKPSLADILKAEKAAQSLPESVAVSPLPVPAPDSPPAGAVEEPDTSAVPAIPPAESIPAETAFDRMERLRYEEIVREFAANPPAPAVCLKAEATPITTAVSFAEAMGELEAALSPNLSGDDDYAAWVVGKILDRQAQIQRVEAQAREMVAQLHNDLSGLAYRFKAPLQEYARRLIESSGRKGQRSVKTLSGTLGFRGGEDCKPTLSIADPERLREWCLEQPDAEQFGAYTFVPDKQKVLAWAKATGEVPRGVEAKAQAEAFFVKSADGVSVNLSRLSAPALPAPDEQEE